MTFFQCAMETDRSHTDRHETCMSSFHAESVHRLLQLALCEVINGTSPRLRFASRNMLEGPTKHQFFFLRQFLYLLV